MFGDVQQFAALVITFAMIISGFALYGIITHDKGSKPLDSNDEYDKKILKKRKRKK
jgi:hypothetical protein|tara:strand:+ start:66 stop:233 length:168 start_codon:yes stop_codon:yes gene_type:complete